MNQNKINIRLKSSKYSTYGQGCIKTTWTVITNLWMTEIWFERVRTCKGDSSENRMGIILSRVGPRSTCISAWDRLRRTLALVDFIGWKMTSGELTVQGDDEVLAGSRDLYVFWKKQRWYKRRSFITNGVSVLKGPITKNGQERIIIETQIHELVWEMGDSQRSITTWCLSPTRWWRLVLSSSRSRLEVTNLLWGMTDWIARSTQLDSQPKGTTWSTGNDANEREPRAFHARVEGERAVYSNLY